MVGTSYAWWTTTAIQNGINQIESDCLNITIEDETNEISLEKAYPLTDEEAKELTPYTFTIKNNCKTKTNYTIKLEKLKKNQEEILNSEYVAIEVNNGQKQILSEYPTSTKQTEVEGYKVEEAKDLINGTLGENETRNYSIKLWMDEHVTLEDDATNKSFISKIVVEGNMNNLAEYTEPILHGADPVLESSSKQEVMLTSNTLAEEPTTTDKLIPVIIDEAGKVTKANTKEEWYNYEEKKWANAVILVDNTKEYKDGEEIPEEAIESYFVWIPKFKYKLFDLGKYEIMSSDNDVLEKSRMIEINFDIEDTKDEIKGECTTPKVSKDSGNCSVGDWVTHLAFISFGVNGLWVGKFETGYNQNIDDSNTIEITESWNKEGAEQNTDNLSKIIIKPNVYSWRYINAANMYNASYNYQRDLDSHMMKNTEWGAVAYLSHSLYGTCTKEKCIEVSRNKSDFFLTGRSESDVSYFNNSFNASTTGNISGIYDMAAGSWERMMNITIDESGKLMYTNEEHPSGFNEDNFPKNSKYYDLYKGTYTWIPDCGILGDATSELGPFFGGNGIGQSSWYGNMSYFPDTQGYPFLIRGGAISDQYAGIFAFIRDYGSVYSEAENISYRIVLAP